MCVKYTRCGKAENTPATPSLFHFRDHSVRVVEIVNEKTGALEPWFVAADVCAALDLSRSDNMLRALGKDDSIVCPQSLRGYLYHRARLNDDEATVNKIDGGSQGRLVRLISESGLYKLVMRAHRSNPEAKAFQDWVTQDVLPAIRKDGGYVTGEEKVSTGEMTDAAPQLPPTS